MSKRKKRKRETDESVNAVLGVAWYTSEQYEQLLQVADDRNNLEDTYEEWKTTAEKMLPELAKPGVLIQKVHIDVEELIAWCKSHNRPIDGAARTVFIADKLEEERQRGK